MRCVDGGIVRGSAKRNEWSEESAARRAGGGVAERNGVGGMKRSHHRGRSDPCWETGKDEYRGMAVRQKHMSEGSHYLLPFSLDFFWS